MARTVGIGIQDFSKIIEKNLFYVDKTGFIKEWWENEDAITLIARPRRFGKTLTLSMLEQFFSVSYAGRDELFKGLSIWKEERYQKLQGTYPVIFLSFARFKGSSFRTVRRGICGAIKELYNKRDFLLDSDCMNASEKISYQQISADMEDDIAFNSLRFLSDCLQKYYGKGALIFLDEYDTPMQEAYVNGYWNELVEFIGGLFNATFKTNPYLERGLMTGITRVSKESIFSDLNNLVVITTTSEKYKESFGFTEKEVFGALEEFGLADKESEVKEWYDGFRFGDCDSIYNPWSIINFLDERKFAAYWSNTSSNKLIEKLIRKGGADIKLVMEDLLTDKDFSTQIDEEIVFNQLDNDEDAIWSLFLASGYLKAEDYCMDCSTGGMQVVLKITNREVHMMFNRMIVGWFKVCKNGYNRFVQSLLADDTESMNAYMNEVALATFSVFDTGKQPSEFKQPENFYHGFVLGLLVALKGRYEVTSNRESGFGRYDVLLEPLCKGIDSGIILEFKVFDPSKEKSIENAVRNALQQIVDKGYVIALKSKGVPADRIRIYGFAFEGKKVLIDGGCLSEYGSDPKSATKT